MELLEIGRIIRPHGLEGRLKVLSYLESQDVLDGLAELFIGRNAQDATVFPLHSVQKGREFFILKLRGIEDKDTASNMVGSSVWMPSEQMKELPDGEYYWHEIIGLDVVTEEGLPLGRIESVFPTGSNDVFVCRGSEKEILLPAIGDCILKIDRDRGIMVVRLLKGLAES
ncbi:MAG TPA: 16S rRNA processing protein RimM [Syntrophus sp. (in: bacteria)]|nr:16S rRNA processing protein RimM [Syntrophus sp. (in: bacteria)]